MAAPKNPQKGPNPKKSPKRNRSKPDDILFEKTREKIQTTQIVKRLNNYVLGKNDDAGQPIKMDNTHIAGARILLDRVIPTLTASTIEATVDATLTLEGKTEDELNARIAELEGMKPPKSP